MELVLLGLCGCTASTWWGILRKKTRAVHRARSAGGGREGGRAIPPAIRSIHLTYLVRGQVSRKAMEDAVRLSKEKYCSVSAMLEKTAKITTPLSTFRDASPSSTAGYFYIASAAFLWAFQRHWVARAFTDICCRAGVAKDDRSADPPQSR